MPEKQQLQKTYTFLEVFQGKLVERAKTQKDSRFKEEEVLNKDGSVRGITYVRPVSGLEQFLLQSITYELKQMSDGTEMQSLKVNLQDATDSSSVYRLQLKYPSVLASTFMKLLPNVPFGQTVDISVFPDKETKQPVLILRDTDGNVIKSAHTKDNPNGMPDAKQSPVTKKWNFTDQNDFLLQNTLEIAHRLKGFWQNNGAMFDTQASHAPVAKPKHPILDDDDILDNDDHEQAKPSPRPILSPQEQLDTFKPQGTEDKLPF